MKVRNIPAVFLVIVFFQLFYNPCFSNVDSLFWKISGNGLKEPSYLFGALHVFCPEGREVGDHLKSALQASRQLILEMDISDPELLMKITLLSRNPGGSNLQQELKEEERKLVDDFLYKHYGYGLAQLGALKPFVLISMVVAKLVPCDQPASYESVLAEIAATDSIPVAGLETPEEQIGFFDQIPRENLLNELVSSVRDFERAKKEFLRLDDAYRRRDLRQIDQLLLETGGLAEFNHILLDRRNEEWLPKIEDWISEGSAFIAVGAGHLLSGVGLIDLLREKGYTVEPVEM